MPSSSDIPKAQLLAELGYGGDMETIERLLEEAGLSHPRKTGISERKRDDVERLVAERFLLVCRRGDCQAAAQQRAGARAVAPASDQSFCAVCGGSVIRRAVDEMIAACRAAGWSRIAVVGGSPNTRQQLTEAVGDALELRLIDGTIARTRTVANADLAWADHVVLWGTTLLDHKVSNLYNGADGCSAMQRRSVSELAAHVARIARKRG